MRVGGMSCPIPTMLGGSGTSPVGWWWGRASDKPAWVPVGCLT